MRLSRRQLALGALGTLGGASCRPATSPSRGLAPARALFVQSGDPTANAAVV